MIIAQSFFFSFEDQELSIILLLDVTLSDHYPIYFTISWQTIVQRFLIMQFFLNMSVLMDTFTSCHILHVWNFELWPHSQTGWIQWCKYIITRTTRFLCKYGRQLVIFKKKSYEANTKCLKLERKNLGLMILWECWWAIFRGYYQELYTFSSH